MDIRWFDYLLLGSESRASRNQDLRSRGFLPDTERRRTEEGVALGFL